MLLLTRWRASLLTPYMVRMMAAVDTQPDAVTLGTQVTNFTLNHTIYTSLP